ncbi:unnamed protein product [Adineta steineri]|uniref:Uncharacterized protein n=1 Tax=Adineta steineri TaxID=433720 RepID=A0A815TXP0_9BILA|nr:unnamed protein product [Adineta steineri]CAF4124423.1 unnamed protein product [Adineta steineri]
MMESQFIVQWKKVSSYTQFENEYEIILRSGTQFRVKYHALDHPNGSYVVHLIEVDEKNHDNNHKALASSMNLEV